MGTKVVRLPKTLCPLCATMILCCASCFHVHDESGTDGKIKKRTGNGTEDGGLRLMI
jgi:hypothetical protein